MAGLCAASEQCSFDIAARLRRMELTPGDVEDIVATLKERNFISDSRYAGSFARDKVRLSSWGRRKIAAALAAKRIPKDTIAEALESIERRDYLKALSRAAMAKGRALDLEDFDDRGKLFRHLISRGFEPDLASKAVERLRALSARNSDKEETPNNSDT